MAHEKASSAAMSTPNATPIIHPNDLARDLHSSGDYFLVDCRPVLAYNSCHISGAVNVNFTGMMKKRFIAGKIGLTDLVTTAEGKEKFKSCQDAPTVVYDDCTSDVQNLTPTNTVLLVIHALEDMGKCPFLLQGGLNEFGVLHPSLCEVSVPRIKQSIIPAPRATTPGVREQALDWQTAPPVHVLSYLVLGSEKDAKAGEVIRDFNIKFVLNVTPKCPNHFEAEGISYKRISVADTGSQKLSNHFLDAFDFIDKARMSDCCILIHCMAGVSRSVTLTIAYLMYRYRMSMQSAYQFVKEKRPAISPNLNFMGQLVEFERELELNPQPLSFQLNDYLPTSAQEKLSERLKKGGSSSGSSSENTPESNKVPTSGPSLFVLQLPAPKHRKGKNKKISHPPLVTGAVDKAAAEGESSSLNPSGAVIKPFMNTFDTKLKDGGSLEDCSWKQPSANFFRKSNPISEHLDSISAGEKESELKSSSPVLSGLQMDRKVEPLIRSFENLSIHSADSPKKLEQEM